MGIFSKTLRAGGEIGYFGLDEWWLTAYTAEERDYIEEKYKPMGASRERPLTQGTMTQTTQTAAGLLIGLSTWFVGPADRHLAMRMLKKAESVAGSDVLDRHLVYSQMIKVYYAERDTQPGAFDVAIAACERQIAIGPQAVAAFWSEYHLPASQMPRHLGFQQLAIIREKQGDYAEALRLCREAQGQGWRDGKGDWSKRIARLEKRAAKA